MLYQHSYLRYDLMHARTHVHLLVNFVSTLHGAKPKAVGTPCFAKRTRRVVNIKDEERGMGWKVTIDIGLSWHMIGSYSLCWRKTYAVFFSLLSIFFPSSFLSSFS